MRSQKPRLSLGFQLGVPASRRMFLGRLIVPVQGGKNLVWILIILSKSYTPQYSEFYSSIFIFLVIIEVPRYLFICFNIKIHFGYKKNYM